MACNSVYDHKHLSKYHLRSYNSNFGAKILESKLRWNTFQHEMHLLLRLVKLGV